MAHPNDSESLRAAWRALSEHSEGDGWRTIQVGTYGRIRILAGRHFPGNLEALLAYFPSAPLPAPHGLPSGRGFSILRMDLEGHDGNGRWICLSREGTGDVELFTAMAEDILAVFRNLEGGREAIILKAFLERVTAWQEFMEKDSEGVLGREAEIGLFGELVMVRKLISAGLPHSAVMEAWQGPLDGLHDFVLGAGAIEVKTTLAPAGGAAMVGSLEQLDESLVAPLFLGVVLLLQREDGETLPGIVKSIQELLLETPVASERFGNRLLKAGFLEAKAANYKRTFKENGLHLIQVKDDFPRLTRSHVPGGIRTAQYEIDLALLPTTRLPLADVLNHLGVTPKWN